MSTSSPASATVLHVIGSLNRGGAETVALDLCRAIPAAQVRQRFVCVSGQRGTLAPQFEEAGAEVVVHGRGGVLRTLLGLVRDIRRERPDVVQAHVSLTSALFLVPARVLGVPRRIARMHSEGDGRPERLRRRLFRSATRRLLAWAATDVLAVSPGALEFARGPRRTRGGAARYEVVVNGVDLERFRLPDRHPDESVVVLHVGRPDPAKNRSFLPPLALALQELAPAQLWVAGGGTEVDMPGEHPGVVDLGPRDDVPELLRAASVLVLPSVREGLPTVALEALASGVPVVASDIGAAVSLAERLPGVEILPLDAPHSHWARRVVDVAGLDADQRRELRAAVSRSDFDLRHNALRWRETWRAAR
ncbi:glycosyltransferase [Nocardioides sp. R1-1]|uniref:glycosyltransferase n=1 Tax=Nocardioides sp. R1-1 TaxID=3383502 RepID=UPI0038D0EFA3